MNTKLIHAPLAAALLLTAAGAAEAQTLLNVSYDPTRELYQAFNAAFTKHWQAKSGKTVRRTALPNTSTIVFRVRKGNPNVLLSWENEAYLALQEQPDKVQIVVTSISILAEPPVAVVDKVVDKKGTRAVAEGYLQYLYWPEGQEIAARSHDRSRDPAIRESTQPHLRR